MEDDARPNVMERPKGGAARERQRITLYQTMAGAMETRPGREPSPALQRRSGVGGAASTAT
jgi:hypothetical protein